MYTQVRPKRFSTELLPQPPADQSRATYAKSTKSGLEAIDQF